MKREAVKINAVPDGFLKIDSPRPLIVFILGSMAASREGRRGPSGNGFSEKDLSERCPEGLAGGPRAAAETLEGSPQES